MSKTIYIDADYRCYVENDGTMTAVETDFFDGKSDAFIEGYRFVPVGETWTRSDGEKFTGEMVSPLTDYAFLAANQEGYDEVLAKAGAAYQEGVNSV